MIFPNPSTGDININISNTERHDVDIRITDAQGRLIWQTIAKTSEQTWSENIYIESNGIYFITIKTGDNIRQEKLIIQR